MPDVNGEASPAELAAELQRAWEHGAAIEPFSARGLVSSVAEAYAVQRAWAEIRAAAGETTVGRKIGLTSDAMRAQMGVNEPDFGDLWGSRDFTGQASISLDAFLQPRVEGEIAFLMRAELAGPGVTEADVRAATSAVAPALEIVDSRIRDWRIELVDTIADDASYGGFACGPWQPLEDRDPAALEMTVSRNDGEVLRARGTSVMGSPLRAVAWLANTLGSFGIAIRPGDVVLSGAFGGALPVAAGDVYTVSVAGLGLTEILFASGPGQETS